jgi:nicotinamide-nucleotide amidase
MEMVLMPDLIVQLAERLNALSWQMVSAESCTGGMIAACCTDVAGSNTSKTQMVGVSPDLIEAQGAVSEAVVHAMAMGAVYRSQAQVSVAVSGIAGPTGGTPEKPVGTVWFGWNINGLISTGVGHFQGDRHAVRRAVVTHALKGVLIRLPHQKS